jgi:hypothetical protein
MTNISRYWISPEGKITEVAFHCDFAWETLAAELGEAETDKLADKDGFLDFSSELHKRGWIKAVSYGKNDIQIMGACIDLHKPMRNTMEPRMNSLQRKSAKVLCEKYGTSLYDALNGNFNFK